MPVRVYWVNDEQTILRYDFEGVWTWEDFYPVYEQAIQMETSVTHRVDIIINMLDSKSIPGNALSHMKSMTDKLPENVGMGVFITRNRFVNILYDSGARFYPKIRDTFVIVSSLEEAMSLITDAQKT